MQGQSAATEPKIRGLTQLISVNLQIVQNCGKRWGRTPTYFHFDLHAGCGWNQDMNVLGSPLAFQRAAQARGASYVLACIDKDESATHQLSRRPEIRDDPRAFVLTGDNSELCRLAPDVIRTFGDRPQYALGSVFIDPNKPTSDTPWNELRWLTRQCPRLDVIVNFPATGMKRIGRGHAEYVSIEGLPDLFNKREWLIRAPVGPWQWCMCIGRNMEKSSGYAKAGFVRWDDPPGVDIRDRARLTKREYQTRGQLEMRV